MDLMNSRTIADSSTSNEHKFTNVLIISGENLLFFFFAIYLWNKNNDDALTKYFFYVLILIQPSPYISTDWKLKHKYAYARLHIGTGI